MKKKLLNLLLTLTMAFAVIGFIGCKDEEKPATPQSLAVVGDSSVCVNDFSLDDYKLTVTMSDGTTQEITLSSTYLSQSDLALLKTAGEHTVTITYQGITVQHTFALSTDSFEGITFPNKTVIYNGNAHSLELVGVPSFANVSYNKATSYTNAGTYPVKATITAENYATLELSATLKINKATYDISGVTYTGTTATYDGQPHTITVGNLPNGVTASVEEKVNAGTHNVTVTFAGDSQNYNPISSVVKTLNIQKATYDMSGVTYTNTTATYDGQPHTITVGNLPNGVTASVEEKVNAGTHNVTVTFAGDSQNYNPISSVVKTLKIDKATYDMSEVTYTGTTTIYDGKPHTITVGNLPNGVTASVEEKTNAGTHNVTVTFTGDSQNYNPISSVVKTLKIDKATYDMSGVTYTGTTAIYDGQPHTITVGNLPNGVTARVEQKSCVNADSYDLTITFTGDSTNYNPIDSVTKTLTINKATVESIAFNGKTYTYDGTKKSLAITGELPDGVSVSYENNGKINADTYTVKAKFTVNGNYNAIPDMTATLTIEKKELTVAFSGATNLTYTGEVQKTISATPTNLVDGDSVQITLTYSGEMIEKGDYTVTASIDEQNYKLTQNNTIAVKISRAVHTLTFKQDGFADVTLTVNDLENITARIPETQKVTGYDIVWVWGENDYTRVTDSWTITAQKTAIPYTITYINNGTSVENITTYTVEDEDILLNIPNNDKGVTFIGWYDENDELIESIDTAIARDITITAKWDIYRIEKATGFTIDCTPTVPTISIILPNMETILTLDDKITVSRGCTLELYIPTVADGNKQLTNDLYDLQEEENTGYLVVRHPSGKTLSYVLTVYRQAIRSYTFMNGESTHDSGTIEETYTVNAPETDPTKTAYTFSHWSVNGERVSFPYTITEDTIFTAEYTPTEYTITLELAGGSLAETTLTYNFETATFTLPTTAIRDYYTFAGWEYNGNSISQITQGSYGDKTITATWTPITYYVSYEVNGGETLTKTPYTIETENLALPTTTRQGYNFVGWFTEATFENQITKIMLGSHGDITVYAKWAEKVNGVHFEGNGNTSGEMADFGIKSDHTSALPENGFIRDGYTFIGWATTANGEVVYADGANYTMGTEESYTLYAVWQANLNSLHFVGNGNTGGETISMTIYTDATKALTANGFEKSYYHFMGWATTPDGEVVYADGASYTMGVNAEYTLYAVWEADVYTITYDVADGENNANNPAEYTVEDTFDFKNATRDYYEFVEWQVNGQLTANIVGLHGNITLTAIWKPISYTITYHVGEGENSSQNPTTFTVESYPQSFVWATPVEGMYSHGWYFDEAFTQECTQISQGGNVDLYAKYCDYNYGLQFTIESNQATVSGYIGTDTAVVIPRIYNGYSVIAIGYEAFRGCSGLTSIVIPDGVTSIGTSAFYECYNLTSAELPDSITKINSSAFRACNKLNSITIPKNVFWMGTYVFYGCFALREINFNATAMYDLSSDNYVFHTGVSKTVTIGANVTQIPAYLFCPKYSNSNYSPTITHVIFEKGSVCRSIGAYAFYNCKGLTYVYYGGTSEQWSAISISSDNTPLTNATRYYYSETEPALNAEGTAYDGNYWHYDDNGEIVIWTKETVATE